MISSYQPFKHHYHKNSMTKSPSNQCHGPANSRGRHNKLLLKFGFHLITTLVMIFLVHKHLSNLPQVNCLQQQQQQQQNPSQHHSHHQKNSAPCHANVGWFNLGHKCYKIIYAPRNLEIAKNRCRELSAELAYIEDEAPKDDESGGTGASSMAPSLHNSSVLAFLVNNIKPDSQNRLFYVNISQDLFKQYKLSQKHESNMGPNGDLSEHIDSDYMMSDLWIPREDPAYTSIRFVQQDNQSDSVPGFVLARSNSSHSKWGLLPITPTRKALSICEMPALNDPRHHARAHSIPSISEHPQSSSEAPKRELVAQSASTQASSHSQTQSAKSAEREVTTTPQPVPEVPSSALFRDIPLNQSIVMGSTSEMRCSPIDNDSVLYWTFNGKNLTQTNRVRLHANGSLRIDHVRNTDGGTYTCTIHSGGLTESRLARLDILERPHQVEYISAELLDKLSTSVTVKWTPGFNGNSPITKYLVEMRTVSSDNIDSDLGTIMQTNQWEVAKANISADQTSIIVPDLKPARKYIFRIKAANRIGTSDPSLPTRPPIEVPTQPPSMAPENLSGSPRSSTSISIQWSPPPADSQNGVIKGYRIRHKLAGYASDTDWYTSEMSEAGLSYVLDDLITWQNYEIQVAAVNDKDVGPFSRSIFVRTKEGKPDKGPRSVHAEALNSTTVRLTWNPPPPQHINGINLGYRVQVWYDVLQSQLAREVNATHNSLTPLQSVTIDSLLPYTEYHVTVKCYTSAGDGVPNEELVMVKTKQDLPEAVQVLEFADVLDRSLRVTWKPPARINGELDYYILEYAESSYPERRTTKRIPANINEARISDLTPQTSYTFKIVPYTIIGAGPVKMNQVKTSVPPVLPEPPSNLTPVNIGAYSVGIQFVPGFDGNAAIEKWIAEALTPTNGDYQARWQTVYISTNHSQGNSVVVRNLRPFTRYRIRLTPANIVGQSRYPSEATAEFQTLQIEPEFGPQDLSVEDIKKTQATARWSPLSNNHWSGIARGYNLTWYENNNSTVNYVMINDTRADKYIVRDLEEFTEYVFKIYAVNGVGTSPASEPVVITTQEDAPSSGPTNSTAQALSSTSVSVEWNAIPKRHRNGLIRGYKVQYQSLKPNAPLIYKSIEDNNTKHLTLTDLKPYTMYHLAVAAFTSVGDGVYGPTISVQTLEDTPGLPQNVSSPSADQNTARILWDPPEDTNGDILGYKISYYALDDSGNANKNVVSQELHHNERTFKATNLKPDTHYVFTVTAKTKQGWGQQANTLVYTYDSELRANLPFFKESWFVILCACVSVVITIIVTALLFIQTKSYKYKQEVVKSTSQDRLGDAGFTIDDDPGSHYNNGFNLLSNQGANHRRSNGAISQSTANFTLPKTPPRPHPGSAVYSDEDDGDDDVFEDIIDKPVKSVAGTSHYDSSGDSVTEKPSEISSSPAPESESNDDEYVNMANKHFVNHYANVNGTLRSQRSWKKNGGASTSQSKHYASNRTNPKLPQRPAPTVPKVPGDHSQSSSDNASSQPMAGTSGMQQQHRSNTNSIYGNSNSMANGVPQQPEPNMRSSQLNGNPADTMASNNGNNTHPKMELQQQNNTHHQQIDLLNTNHISLNSGRIIVDNKAGSRAPLPGFTSFV